MITIERGNYLKKTLTLQDDTTVEGGLFVGCDVILNGFTFTLNAGGNYRGIKVDSVRLDSASPPADVTIGPGVILPATYTRKDFHPKAIQILKKLWEKAGDEGIGIWLQAVEEIVADPAITKPNLVVAVETWAGTDPGDGEVVNSVVDISLAFSRISSKWFPATSFADIKLEILDLPVGAWYGEPEVEVEVL